MISINNHTCCYLLLAIDCGSPESSDYTNETDIAVSAITTTLNSIATYTCVEEGMIVVGPNTRTCSADGNWTDTSPMECTCKLLIKISWQL